MKQTPRKKITSILLSLTLMLSMMALPSMAMPVQAADAKIQTGLQNVVIGTGTNTTPTVIGFGGKQWVVIGYNGTGVNSQTGNMTLLLSKDSSYGSTQYDDTSSYSNVYSGSTLHAAMTSAGNTPLSEEQSLIIPVGLEGGSANGSGTIKDDKMAGESVADQLFWPLSVSEAESLNNNVRMFTYYWWLRSAGYYSYNASVVYDNGNVNPNGSIVYSDYIGVRPALKINLTSVIFSSSAAGGKPTTVGANLSAATQPTAEQKLTVIDSGQTLNVIATTAEQSQSGGTLSFSYDGATTGTNQTVSCVLTDSGGAVEYYGKLEDTSVNDSGTLSIPLSGVTNGTYTLRIFSEQDNGTNYTDFASTPVDMTVNVTGGSGTVSGYTGSSAVAPTINGSATGTTTRRVTTGYAASEQIDFTVAGTPAPSFAVTSDGGTGATLAGNRLNISTGLAANTYTITLAAINSQGSATHTVTFTVSDVISYNITVNAGAGGTATGGGSLAENTTATVVATANTGYKFKQWTESGNVVTGAGASYSFVVTAPRTLDAEFEPDGSVTTTAPTINNSANGTTNRTVTLGYSDPEHFDFALGGTPAPTLSVTSDSGAGATVTGNRLTIPTGLALGRYTIALTADNLTATKATHTVIFIVSDGSTPPPIITGGGSSSGRSSGGTSKADVAPTAGTTTTSKPFTKDDATKLFNAALAAKPEGGTTLSIKARNYTSVDKSVLAELTALAEKNGVTLTVHFDVVSGGKVTSRISVNPAVVATNLDLTVKLVGNKITLPKLAIPTEVAVKMPAGMTIENLKITQNGVDITASAKPWLDKNGYVHFTTTGGEIVLAAK